MNSAAMAREPNLRVSEIRVQDFRTIKDLWMPVRSSLVLLGENNAGKSSFLGALDVALGTARAREEDLRQDEHGIAATRFCVDILVIPASGTSFSEDVAQVLGAAVQLKRNEPEFFALRCKADMDAKRGELTFRRTFLKGWARTRADAELLAESNFTVTREARELISFNLLDARRDGVEQLRNRRTFWGQIVADPQLSTGLRNEAETTIHGLRQKLVAGSPPLVTLQQELRDIRSVIAHPQLDVEVSPLPGNVEDLLRATDLLLTEAGQRALPIGVQGMGTRSLAALLIFRAYVRSVLSTTKGPTPLSVAAFEEPEAHLHPQAQRAVLNVIEQIPGQRIISTHSPFIAAIADVYDVRLFRRGRDGTTVTWVPDTDPTTGAARFDEEALAQLRRFVQRRHGEILFARVVGLFEGDTEDAALPVFARALWPGGADCHGVSLVNVGGAGNYKHLLTLLEALEIPWVILSDGDQAGVDGVAAAGKAIGRTLDATSPEVVMLPKGNDFEAQILAEGFQPQAECAIARFFGTDALANFRAKNHGQKGRGGTLRDYQAPGWEDRLLADFMDRNKGTYGAALASEIVAAKKLPTHVQAFLSKIDAILKASP